MAGHPDGIGRRWIVLGRDRERNRRHGNRRRHRRVHRWRLDGRGLHGGSTGGGSAGGGSTGGGSSSGDEAAYADAWSASKVYTAGAHVSVGNAVYEANWWTSGDDPATHSGAGGGQVWTFVGYMDTTPVTPDAPADLHAVSTAGTSTVLVWDAATVKGVGTISGYNIYEGDTLIATTSNTYYKVTGLNPSSDYKFSVVAIDEAGASQHSNVIDVVTHAGDTSGAAKSFSPYVDMSLTTSQNLVQMVSEAGLSAVTLAFVLSSGTDKIGWGGIGTIVDDTLSNGTKISTIVDTLHSMGVDVTISFGGANGQEPAATATSAQALVASYQSVIDKYHVTHLDFDIEGAAIANTAENATRNAALAALEKANPDLDVSFTLPVLTTGLTQDGINFLKAAMAAGVHIDTINIMAMDYGAYYDTGDMGKDAISAATATLQQLHDIGLDSHIVITPMIGINDVTSEVFTLEDAHQLVDFVAANDQVDGIAMWSLGRDNGSEVGHVSPVGSGLTQSDYAFSEIFNGVSSGTAATTATQTAASVSAATVTSTGTVASTSAVAASTVATSPSSTTAAATTVTTGASTSGAATTTAAGTADAAHATGDAAHTATTTSITWAWGAHQAIDFHPDTDTLDFGWMSADNFKVSEENGSVVISIPSNDQTYTLTGVTLSEMNIEDVSAKDASTVAEWKALIDAAHATAVADTTDPLHAHDGVTV
ncbi:fibronectin type III domain-containing protein [Segnochrobactrum spirostomi]|uniref:fibronectin type III domain-containing protein n=1 Tax=Segnochrobactrum spirostomi TaxID=2608987 RepID=UPI001FEAFC24|nr:glycosyl hydrolase family 18 protein [Segnochrobactrum spirostomi]